MGAQRVFLVRHAKAEKDGSKGDSARRLTREGREAFARLLRDRAGELEISRILTSPFARALETARLLADATGAPVALEDDLASGHATGAALLRIARTAGAGAALVGHNPEVQEAVALAAGRDEPVRPGTIAAVDLDGGRARLAWIAAPDRHG